MANHAAAPAHSDNPRYFVPAPSAWPFMLTVALAASAAAMSLVNTEANSTIPALGYTGTYAFANVILTVAGTLIMFA